MRLLITYLREYTDHVTIDDNRVLRVLRDSITRPHQVACV